MSQHSLQHRFSTLPQKHNTFHVPCPRLSTCMDQRIAPTIDVSAKLIPNVPTVSCPEQVSIITQSKWQKNPKCPSSPLSPISEYSSSTKVAKKSQMSQRSHVPNQTYRIIQSERQKNHKCPNVPCPNRLKVSKQANTIPQQKEQKITNVPAVPCPQQSNSFVQPKRQKNPKCPDGPMSRSE